MRPYPRPFLKSSRVRHFAAGLGVALLLGGVFAATGAAPKRTSEGIMDLSVDVRDVPCDEPFNEDERVQVIPDTLEGRIGVQVVVRNRQCCCCGEDVRLGELRQSAPPTQVRPTSLTAPQAAVTPRPEVKSSGSTTPDVIPAPRTPLSPLASRPGTAPGLGGPSDVSAPASTVRRARLPWYLALAAVPAAFLFGSDGNDVCEDDETGANSGPSRTCDADAQFRRAQDRDLEAQRAS